MRKEQNKEFNPQLNLPSMFFGNADRPEIHISEQGGDAKYAWKSLMHLKHMNWVYPITSNSG